MSSRQVDGSRAPSWSSRLTKAMASKSSSRLARARSPPAKTLIPRPLASPSSGLRSAWRAVGRTGPSPALDQAHATCSKAQEPVIIARTLDVSQAGGGHSALLGSEKTWSCRQSHIFDVGQGATVAFFEYRGHQVDRFAKPAGVPDERTIQFDHVSLNLPHEAALL
jgi:hypothetical protein